VTARGDPSSADGGTAAAGRGFDVVHDGAPYFAIQRHCIFVHRGWGAEVTPISLADWLALVEDDPELDLDEVFEETNINAGWPWRVREPGRARWARLSADERLHFRRPAIAYLFGKKFPGGPSHRKWLAIVDRIGVSPTLEEWSAYVGEDRWLAPVEEWAEAAGTRVRRAGSVLYGARRGARRLLRYEPAAVWCYRSSAQEIRRVETGRAPMAPAPDAERWQKALAIAERLGALAFDGARYFEGPATGSTP
jgi:hypothetical protein